MISVKKKCPSVIVFAYILYLYCRFIAHQSENMNEEQQFCLRWNNFQANITSQFEALRDEEDFVDVTLACDGQRLKAHKVVLSACSPYFKELFKVCNDVSVETVS